MSEIEKRIRVELDRLAPDPGSGAADLADVRRLAQAYEPRRSRRSVALVLAAATIALSGSAFAFNGGVRSMIGLERPGPEPVLQQAELLLSTPVGNGFWTHAWTAPSSTGGQCDFFTVTRDRAAQPLLDVNGSSTCSNIGEGERLTRASPDHPLTIGLSISRRLKGGDPAKWMPPVVSGAVLPSLHATRVEVRWNGGSLPLRLKDGFFLGGSPLLYMPPFERFPFLVLAYDANGTKVAEKRLPSPALRLMNGWKEYTRAYQEWQRNRE